MAPLRDAIWSVDRHVPISAVQTMEGRIARSIGRPRLMMTLLGTFAALGVLIAALGVYGVVAYSIAQRPREIGIMIALGAGRATVVGSVLREGLVYAAAGLGLGLPAAFGASRLLATLVFGVRPTDPATYAVIAWTIAALVAAACALPAYRASRATSSPVRAAASRIRPFRGSTVDPPLCSDRGGRVRRPRDRAASRAGAP